MHNADAIWIGSDHGGFELRQSVIAFLRGRALSVQDVSSFSREIVRYPVYAARVASAVSRGETKRGILICSTGIGMSIIANEFRGVRAALCTSTYMARMTRAHNDSDILCLGGKVTGECEALDIVGRWLDTPYEGGRHDVSLSLITEAEATLCNPGGREPAGPVP